MTCDGRLVINAVNIMTLVEEIELIDAFGIHLFPIDTFLKLAVARDRLVMDAVTLLTMVAEMDPFVRHGFAINTF